jgi:putative transposase
MPEHVHVVVTHRDSVERAVQMIKGGSSFAVREQLAGVVWQDAYYDHRVRDEQNYRQQPAYVAGHLEKRGLVDYPGMPTRYAGCPDGFGAWIGRLNLGG